MNVATAFFLCDHTIINYPTVPKSLLLHISVAVVHDLPRSPQMKKKSAKLSVEIMDETRHLRFSKRRHNM